MKVLCLDRLGHSAERLDDDRGTSAQFRAKSPARRAWRAALLVAALTIAASTANAQPAIPQGVWLIDGRAAVQIYDCAGMMCGRILWLNVPRNALGELDRDYHNPDPALRTRELCGLTMLWNLHPDGPNRWKEQL